MRILYVTPAPPWPPLKGYQLRAYEQLRRLSRRHTVQLVTFASTRIEASIESALRSLCADLTVLHQRPVWRRAAVWRVPFTGTPAQVLLYSERRLKQELQRAMHRFRPDVVHLQLARLGEYLPAFDRAPVVLDLVDSLTLNFRRRATLDRGPAAALARLEAQRLERYERALCRQVSAAIVVGEGDRLAIGVPDVQVIPLGVDGERFPFSPQPRPPARLIFSGNMGYFPNRDGAEWLLRDIMPRIAAQRRDVSLAIVGAGAPQRWRASLAPCPVAVTGWVPSIQDELAKATLALCPLRTGSGMKIKILEAMAIGTPVVATRTALEGIEAEPGVHCLAADDAQAFADAVIGLLQDREAQRRLAEAARLLVEQRYSWDTSVEQLEAVYTTVTQGRAPAGACSELAGCTP